MPRDIRYRNGRRASIATPLEASRLTKTIEGYRGKPFNIYVDESMRSFFGFEQPNGYLCYAAVGVPSEEHEFVRRMMEPIFKDYEVFVTGDPDVHLREFKFDRFRSLPEDQRRALSIRIQKVLKACGCFVTAFFLRTKACVMEQVRSGLVGEQDSVPDEHTALYDAAAQELRKNEENGVARSETIVSILRIPLAGLAHYMGYFQCPFTIYCDPREAKEDKAVLNAIDEYFKGPMDVIAPNESRLYQGMDNTIDSESEIGLQLADMLTGEVRTFFEENSEFLTAESSLDLITGSSEEDLVMFTTTMGMYHKYGSLIDIPAPLVDKLRTPNGISSLPIYRPAFAAGLLSCYTDLGQPRHIELYQNHFFQQLD